MKNKHQSCHPPVFLLKRGPSNASYGDSVESAVLENPILTWNALNQKDCFPSPSKKQKTFNRKRENLIDSKSETTSPQVDPLEECDTNTIGVSPPLYLDAYFLQEQHAEERERQKEKERVQQLNRQILGKNEILNSYHQKDDKEEEEEQFSRTLVNIQRVISQTSIEDQLDANEICNELLFEGAGSTHREENHFAWNTDKSNNSQLNRDENQVGNQWDNLRDEYRRNYEVHSRFNGGNLSMDESFNQYLPNTLGDENSSQVSDGNSLYFLPNNQSEEV